MVAEERYGIEMLISSIGLLRMNDNLVFVEDTGPIR
jgi:hypothetical protein